MYRRPSRSAFSSSHGSNRSLPSGCSCETRRPAASASSSSRVTTTSRRSKPAKRAAAKRRRHRAAPDPCARSNRAGDQPDEVLVCPTIRTCRVERPHRPRGHRSRRRATPYPAPRLAAPPSHRRPRRGTAEHAGAPTRRCSRGCRPPRRRASGARSRGRGRTCEGPPRCAPSRGSTGTAIERSGFATLMWTMRRTPARFAAANSLAVFSTARSNVVVPRSNRTQYVL